MTLRFTLHSILCTFFTGLGWWLYLQLYKDGNGLINSISVASYWFGFLIFVLFSWFFYWILHRRSTKSWLIAQLIALLIAIIATLSILFISHQHENRRKAEKEALLLEQESQSLQSEEDDINTTLMEEGSTEIPQ